VNRPAGRFVVTLALEISLSGGDATFTLRGRRKVNLRRGDLDRAAVDRCLSVAEAQLNGYEYLIPSDLVMKKVALSTCSAYDCEYVALADDLGTMLVTSDRQILAAFPSLTTSLKGFAGRDELAEDAEDLAVFDARKNEPTMAFEDSVKALKRRGRI
jgi:hypothetical protein